MIIEALNGVSPLGDGGGGLFATAVAFWGSILALAYAALFGGAAIVKATKWFTSGRRSP